MFLDDISLEELSMSQLCCKIKIMIISASPVIHPSYIWVEKTRLICPSKKAKASFGKKSEYTKERL